MTGSHETSISSYRQTGDTYSIGFRVALASLLMPLFVTPGAAAHCPVLVNPLRIQSKRISAAGLPGPGRRLGRPLRSRY
jgi:hypothetical protein